MEIDQEEPHWEHGYRCHGYWLRNLRIGFVSIQPGIGSAKKFGYSWSFDLPATDIESGHASTLKAAKRLVERAYRRYADGQKKKKNQVDNGKQ